MSKASTLSETYFAIQSIHKGTVKEITDLLRSSYSAEWSDKNYEAARKQAERDLKVLIQMELIEKDDTQKAHRYAVKRNYAFKSDAAKHYDAIQEILKNNEELFEKVHKPLSKLMNELESPYFIKKNIEDISEKIEILSQLEHAINNSLHIDLRYQPKDYPENTSNQIRPLKIAEFDGFFYLLCKGKKYYKLRISNILDCTVTTEKFTLTELDELKLRNWHNVWHQPDQIPNRVKLWISDIIIDYFYDKNIFNINENRYRVKECNDGVEYHVEITHPMELLPQLMQWLPRVAILEDVGELDILSEYKNILRESMEKIGAI